ncbi:chymotrypsin-like protease CTRL-1 [Misgurnus anguillicaudatus]|uniref:chymotrypsin-like protease CTRL-1 n=1 Tax=Misgurnus anguillicaudatus TaxID=75329 RepID=UPI003CCF0999
MRLYVILLCFIVRMHCTQDCGIAPLNTRVVGGTNALPGSWPWQVSIHFNGRPTCGGTLIHSQWVMTAAHCIASTDINQWTLYLGRETQITSTANPNANEVSVGVQSITVHPKYNNTLYDYDICLMKLNEPVIFTNYIRPVCLASNASVFHNATTCWATGWGKIGKDEVLPAPKTLQEVEVPIVSNRQCACQYKPTDGDIITSQMICAGRAGKGVCQGGDSGGPLQCKQGSVWVQAGITSFGVPCATEGFPEVYSRVSEFQSWVSENVNETDIGFVTYLSRGTDRSSNFNCTTAVSNGAISLKFTCSSNFIIIFTTLTTLNFLIAHTHIELTH